MYLVLRGLSQLLAHNFGFPIDTDLLLYWGSGKRPGLIPVSAVYLLLAAVVEGLVARPTVFGTLFIVRAAVSGWQLSTAFPVGER